MNCTSTNKLNIKHIKDNILIKEVKNISFLYDKSEMNHKRVDKRKVAWDEIGKILGMDGIDCMNRWKILRDRYRKERRCSRLSSKPSCSKKTKWAYFDMLSFLDPHLEDIKPSSEQSVDLLNQQDSQSSIDDPPEQDNSHPSQANVLILHDLQTDSAPLQSIRIIVPKTKQHKNLQHSPRKYVKILPKSDIPPEQRYYITLGNNLNKETKQSIIVEDAPITVDAIIAKDATVVKDVAIDDSGDESSNNSLDLSFKEEVSSSKKDTVDHLMAFMGNTIKQLPPTKQMKICQELTSAFFNIVSKEDSS